MSNFFYCLVCKTNVFQRAPHFAIVFAIKCRCKCDNCIHMRCRNIHLLRKTGKRNQSIGNILRNIPMVRSAWSLRLGRSSMNLTVTKEIIQSRPFRVSIVFMNKFVKAFLFKSNCFRNCNLFVIYRLHVRANTGGNASPVKIIIALCQFDAACV